MVITACLGNVEDYGNNVIIAYFNTLLRIINNF